jgi:hypothetical protein
MMEEEMQDRYKGVFKPNNQVNPDKHINRNKSENKKAKKHFKKVKKMIKKVQSQKLEDEKE